MFNNFKQKEISYMMKLKKNKTSTIEREDSRAKREILQNSRMNFRRFQCDIELEDVMNGLIDSIKVPISMYTMFKHCILYSDGNETYFLSRVDRFLDCVRNQDIEEENKRKLLCFQCLGSRQWH